jgi:hypothetical protein
LLSCSKDEASTRDLALDFGRINFEENELLSKEDYNRLCNVYRISLLLAFYRDL